MPRNRMTFDHEIVLTDRNKDERICTAEAVDTTHQTLMLIRDVGVRAGVIIPVVNF